ncbi:unnamed protein product [Hanseniaspora opuntiae]
MSDINTGSKKKSVYSFTDVIQLEHAVNNFKSALKTILDLSPDIIEHQEFLKQDFQEIVDESPELIHSLSRYKLRLAAEIVSLAELNKLPLFGNDKSTNLDSYGVKFDKVTHNPNLSLEEKMQPLLLTAEEFSELKELKKTNPKLGKQNQLEATKSNENNIMDTIDNAEVSSDEEEDMDIEPTTSNSLPSSAKKAKVDLNNERIWPPKLPELEDVRIRARIFTHKSVIKDKDYLSARDKAESHNERLEFLGDSILNYTMTLIIYEKFPHMNEGHMSVLRMKLINNEIIRQWAILYNFHKMLKLNIDQTNTLNMETAKHKFLSDVFEAYLGGLYEENPKKNLPIIKRWLKKLSAPMIQTYKDEIRKNVEQSLSMGKSNADNRNMFPNGAINYDNLSNSDGKSIGSDGLKHGNPNMYNDNFNQSSSNMLSNAQLGGGSEYETGNANSKKLLYSLIGYANLGLHYHPVTRADPQGSLAEVECRIGDGSVLGRGYGKNIKIAGRRAAEAVLNNKELIEKYARIRASKPKEQTVVKNRSDAKVNNYPSKGANGEVFVKKLSKDVSDSSTSLAGGNDKEKSIQVNPETGEMYIA